MTKYSEFADLLEYLASCIRTWEAEKNARLLRDLDSPEDPSMSEETPATAGAESDKPRKRQKRTWIPFAELRKPLGLSNSKMIKEYVAEHNIPCKKLHHDNWVPVECKEQIIVALQAKLKSLGLWPKK